MTTPAEKTWRKFGKEAVQGLYGGCFEYPEYDADVDDEGRTVGYPTGGTCQSVKLVIIDFEPGAPDQGGYLEINLADHLEVYPNDFLDEAVLTHYMEPETPKAPTKDQL